MSQGPRIDFESEGATIVLYLESPGGASIVDAGGEIPSYGSSYAFLDAFSKNSVFVPQMSFVQQESVGAMAHPSSPPPVAWAL